MARAARAGEAEHASTHRAGRGWATQETGLYYHGARYYAPWLGRWTAADPAGMVDGLNLYRYSRCSPVNFSDDGGTQSTEFDQRHIRFESTVSGSGEASFSLTIDLRNTATGEGEFRTFSGGVESLSSIGEQLSAGTGIGAGLSQQEREGIFQGLVTFQEQAFAARPDALTLAGPALERGIWQGRNFRDRGYTLEHLYNNDIPKALRATGDNRPNYDVETDTRVKQIKSSNAGPKGLRGHASKATTDAGEAVAANPTRTMTGKQPQAVVITPTDAPPSAGADIRAGYNRMRTPVPNSAPPEHVRGLPGAVGAVGRGLTIGGTLLSGAALISDLVHGDYPMAGADALSTVGGALEIFAIAGGGAIAGISALSAGLVLGGLGIAAASTIGAVRSYERGDTLGVVAGVLGAAAGVAIVAGVIASAPALVIGGVIAAAVVGGFHLVRWLQNR